MNSLGLKARAKINISLDVLGKRADGYHEVRMLMQTVELHDTVYLEEAGKGIIDVECDCPEVPEGRGNIAYRAAELLIAKYGIGSGIRIKIEKRIPAAAGLAGGSTDAAAVLKGMNRIFSLGLGQGSLMELGLRLGADVPYCVMGGTALAEGLGEILTQLGSMAGMDIVLVKPDIDVSTAWVYGNFDPDAVVSRPDTEALLKAVGEGRPDALAANMINVLETVTAKRYGIIGEIKRRLMELGAMGSVMSGSGPAVFGIFPDRESAVRAYGTLKSERAWGESFLTRSV